MKKVSKKVTESKLNESKYTSLNGNMLKKIKGGIVSDSGETDRACKGGCGSTAGYTR